MNPELVAIQMKLFGGKQVAAESKTAARGIESVGTAAKKSQAQQSAMRSNLQRQVTSMRSIGTALTRVLTVPIAAAGAAAGFFAYKFDEQMRNVNSIAQLPERQFRRLSESVSNLAGPTAQAPVTLAEGMYQLVSSGFDARQSLQIVEKAAYAASAGLTTTDVSTKAVAAALNAYELPVKKAGFISDVLFRTVDRGVLSFEELASNIGKIIPFAASSGISLSEVGAGVATLTKQGQSGAEAITFLKNTIVAFNKPSEALGEAIKKTGFESGEALIKARGFQGALAAVAGTTDQSRAAMTELFPNIRAQAAVFGLTGEKARAASADLAGFNNVSGATQHALKEQEKSFAFQVRRSWAYLQDALIDLGKEVLPLVIPPLLSVLKIARDLAHAFSQLPEPIRNTALVFVGIAALSGPLLRLAAALLQVRLQMMLLEATGGGGGLLGGLGKGGLKKLLIRGGIGAGGVLAAQAGGEAVGGDLGSWLKGAGTGAGAGFAVAGAPGALVGGAIGGVAVAVGKVTSEMHRETAAQHQLSESAKQVVRWHRRMHSAFEGLNVAERKLTRAQQHHRDTLRRQTRLEAQAKDVREQYGAKSRQTLRIEQRLQLARSANRRAINRLKNAEREHGIAAEQTKTILRQTMLEDRHRLNVIRRNLQVNTENWRQAKRTNASEDRLNEISKRGTQLRKDLGDAQKRQSETLREAASKIGPKYARFLQNAKQETLRFGGAIKETNLKAEAMTRTLKGLAEMEVTVPHIRRGGRGRQGGGFVSRSELTMVGEAGPEIVRLPYGARVYPHGATPRGDGRVNRVQMGAAQRGGRTYLAPVVLRVGRRKLAEVIAETQEDEAARE